jgi:hypothetical protein
MRTDHFILTNAPQILGFIAQKFANSAQFQNIFCLNMVFSTKYENVPENHIRWRP